MAANAQDLAHQMIVFPGAGDKQWRLVSLANDPNAVIILTTDVASDLGICEANICLRARDVSRLFPTGWTLYQYSRPKPAVMCERMGIDLTIRQEKLNLLSGLWASRDHRDVILLSCVVKPLQPIDVDFSDQGAIEDLRTKSKEMLVKYGHDDSTSEEATEFDHNSLTEEQLDCFSYSKRRIVRKRAGVSGKLSTADLDDDSWFWQEVTKRLNYFFDGLHAGPLLVNPYEPKDWEDVRAQYLKGREKYLPAIPAGTSVLRLWGFGDSSLTEAQLDWIRQNAGRISYERRQAARALGIITPSVLEKHWLKKQLAKEMNEHFLNQPTGSATEGATPYQPVDWETIKRSPDARLRIEVALRGRAKREAEKSTSSTGGEDDAEAPEEDYRMVEDW